MRIQRVSLLVVWVLFSASWANADYLEVRRSATIKIEPRGDAEIIFRPNIGSFLILLEVTQTNGYYKVEVPCLDQEGWIFRTLARRHAGDPPVSPEENCEHIDFSHRHLRLGKPRLVYTRVREGYAVGFDGRLKIPIWVQYQLIREELDGPGNRDRSEFEPDTSIPRGFRSELEDYRGSGFDRGHMAPAADMKRSQRVMDESHLLSNIAPQIGIGFNRHIWAGLESLVRDWVRERGTLTIIIGPVFEAQGNRVQYGVIGPNEVAAPTHFFKIVVDMNDPNNPDAIAFLMPNENLSGREPEEFITSIDDIESRTGIDFLTALSDPVERPLEALTAGAIW